MHSSIGLSPTDARKDKYYVDVLFNNQEKTKRRKKPKFQQGDNVRISRIKGKFEKGDQQIGQEKYLK